MNSKDMKWFWKLLIPPGPRSGIARRVGDGWRSHGNPGKKVILEPGDLHAAHGGSKGILNIGPLQFNLGNEYGSLSAAEPTLEDPYLEPWVRWLDKMNWDDRWNEET